MRRQLLRLCALTAAALALAPAAALADGANHPGIHPGVQTFTDGAQCTANFIFRDGGGTYIGQSAHCSGTGGATETNGCDSGSLPLGTQVEVDGATRPGTLVYNSWIAMQQAGERDANTCEYNDFALVRIDPADAGRVDPNVPGFGGPTGLAAAPTALGTTVYTYGNSSLRLGVTKLSPKQGSVIQNQGGGWSRVVYTATPGVFGDSGSGFLDGSGRAIGTLSTLQVLPFAGSNGVANLADELAYARSHGFGGVELVPGTRAFNPNLPAAIGSA